jgi:hypothetical protein
MTTINLETRMNHLLEDIRFLTLDEQISINEGVLTEDDLDGFVNSVCESLADDGYEVPDEFTLEEMLEAISAISSNQSLDEGFKEWLGRAASAVKGAISRGVSHAKRIYHKGQTTKHAKKMNDAWDAGDKEAYVHHSVKMHAHWKKSDPVHFYRHQAHANAQSWGSPGTIHHAEKTWTSHPVEQHKEVLKARHERPQAVTDSPRIRGHIFQKSADSKAPTTPPVKSAVKKPIKRLKKSIKQAASDIMLVK